MCVVGLPVDFYLILTDEFLVWDVGRQICVQEGTESQAIAPAAAEVGHVNILRERERESNEMKNKPLRQETT